ncbi:MAG: serine hydrolase [Bacteroidales bacterium]|nr:serine hydrolase [Bacteroidales bacterium]MDD4670925.1 serine hydrolase [Bacteroidales bacterium]
MINKISVIDSLVNDCGIPALQLVYHEKFNDVCVVSVPDSASFMDNDVTANSIFQAASLSKPVFAYIVMKMVDNGEIDLDKPIAEYTDIDRFEDKEQACKLTARMVLSHKSGLPNWAAGPSSEEWPTSIISFKYPADSCFSYSGEGYAFLQRAVEAIRHSTLDEIARKEVFEPFDMPTTSYRWLPQYDTLALPGFNRDSENRGTGRHPRENCAYTLRTNAVEYSRFVTALMEGKGLSKQSHKEMLTPQVHAIRYADEHRDCDSTIYWCIGIGSVKPSDAAAPKYYWHWGDNGNFKALFIFRPEDRSSVVYFTDSAKGHDIVTPILQQFFGETLPISDWINN